MSDAAYGKFIMNSFYEDYLHLNEKSIQDESFLEWDSNPFLAHMPKRSSRWTKEACRQVALEYSSRKNFERGE